MEIVRKKLTPNEVTPPNTRYNSDCDCIQTTPDGGTTWNDGATASDPRYGDMYRKPVRTGGDPQCDAAENMREALKKNIDDILLATNVGAIGSVMMVDLLLLTAAAGFLAGLAVIIAGAILDLTLTAVDAAFTDAVYDQLFCIFYANISGDGSVDATQLDAIKAQVSSDIGGIVSTVFNLYMSLWGEVNLSNAGAVGGAAGDCTVCTPDNCGAQVFDFITVPGGWTCGAPFSSFGVHIPTLGWEGQYDGSGSNQLVIWFQCSAPNLNNVWLEISNTHGVTGTVAEYDSSAAFVRNMCLGFGLGAGTNQQHECSIGGFITDPDCYIVIILTTTSFQNMELSRVSFNEPLP